mmetsp:Transcript_19257/g.31787  ORF Transcript_19257/g.31787 Transcript_19257/m.31787 type:complete len:199 (+) Transcript_19257:400-996(+)
MVIHYRQNDVKASFQPCIQFIEEAKGKGICLVHCARGRSRSAAVVLAYLMIKEGMNLKQAYLHVKKRRPYIGPAGVLRPQLIALEQLLGMEQSLTVETWSILEASICGNPSTIEEELKEIEDEANAKKDRIHLEETEKLKTENKTYISKYRKSDEGQNCKNESKSIFASLRARIQKINKLEKVDKSEPQNGLASTKRL